MKIIGLTGTIASGKSFICQMIKDRGYKVFEADTESREIIKRQDIIDKLKEKFSECFEKGVLNKAKLSDEVFTNKEKLRFLESLIHPEVIKARNQFIKDNINCKIIFIEAPLLFEVGYEKICDKVIVVLTDIEILKKRALQRENMNEKRLEMILNHQISNNDKKNRADFIIYNGQDINDVSKQLDTILLELTK